MATHQILTNEKARRRENLMMALCVLSVLVVVGSVVWMAIQIMQGGTASITLTDQAIFLSIVVFAVIVFGWASLVREGLQQLEPGVLAVLFDSIRDDEPEKKQLSQWIADGYTLRTRDQFYLTRCAGDRTRNEMAEIINDIQTKRQRDDDDTRRELLAMARAGNKSHGSDL